MAKLPTTLGERAVPRPQRRIASVTPGIEASGYREAAAISDRTSQRLAGDLRSVENSLLNVEQEKAQLSLANAKSKFLRDQISIEAEFDRDQEWSTFGTRYDERVRRAKSDAAASISDPRARAMFEADADIDIARGAASIGSKASAKETDSARAGLNQTIDSNLQAALLLPNVDKAGQASLFKATGNAIDASFRSGYISAQEAQEQKTKFAQNYALAWVSKLPSQEALQFLIPQGTSQDDGYNRSMAGVRRLAPGEFVQNADGSRSTERSITVTHPKLNGGKPTNIPSIWMVDGKITELSFDDRGMEDRAVEFALQSGETWQSYGSIKEAEDAAKKRSNAGGRFSDAKPQTTPAGKSMLPIQTASAIDAVVGGSDAEIIKRIVMLESNGNPDAVNPQSGAAGIIQLMPATAKQYGVTDPKDLKQSAKASVDILNDNRRILRATLGREPTGAELYLAHQQGATGASALLENPDQLAISTLAVVYGSYDKAKAAILQNGGHENMTAGQFSSLWQAKFDGRPVVMNQDYEIPEGGYDFTKKTGTPVDFIPVDKRMALIESSLLDLKRNQDKARVGAQVDVNLSYGDWQRNAELTGTVDPLQEAKIMAAHPNEQGARLVAGLKESAETGKLTKIVTAQTLEEDRALLDAAALDASKPGEGSARAADQYRRIAEVVKAKHDALASDPAEYVRQANPTISDAWDEAVADPTNKHAFRTAISFSETEQKRLGLSDVQVMPKDVATAIVNNVMGSKTPKDQLDALLQYVDMGDPETSRQVMTELFAVKGGLPEGSALIVDIAVEGENKKLAERLWTELHADTSGAKMEKANYQTLDGALGEGIMEVLSGQASVTGDFSGAQASQMRATAEQIAKARGLLTGDYDAAAQSAVADLTGQFSMIADDSFAFVYYPSKLETINPGAMERGLLTLRMDVAKAFPPDPYSQATARDITNMAVWVNDRDGLSLMVPGTTRHLMHVSYEDALKRGLEMDAAQEGQKQWVLPGVPQPEITGRMVEP